MNRRKFLKNVLGTGAAAGTGVLGNFLTMSGAQANHVASAGSPTLVVIFQRGGCDGLNTVVPYADPDYYTLRPTIGIARPDASNPLSAIRIDSASSTDFFGLNPNMVSLKKIYDANDLAVLPTVQYASSTHSHFSGQDWIESGIPTTSSNGWLYRHLDAQNKLSGLQGLSFGSNLAKSLRGSIPVQSIGFLDQFGFPSSSGNLVDQIKQYVLPLYNDLQVKPAASKSELLVGNTGKISFDNLDTISAINAQNYTPAPGVNYPAGRYGRRLREIAQLIKTKNDPMLNINLDVVTVDIGGFDTHTNQGGAGPNNRHSRQIREFSEGIAALYDDLGSQMDEVIILSVTEFGRTAKENGSAGTDHGDASSWFMVGKGINGGIHGRWPGLSAAQLRRGRYLSYTVDYRDIYAEILMNHFGHTQAQAQTLLSHTYNSIGLFA